MPTPSELRDPHVARVTLCAGAVLETALLPYYLVDFIAHWEVDVFVSLSKEAHKFTSRRAIRAISGHKVYTKTWQLDSKSGQPLHKQYSQHELVVVYPASPRILSEAANGNVTCPVTRIIAFAPKEKIIVAPFVHPMLCASVYAQHLLRLEEIGCQVVQHDNLHPSWRDVEATIVHTLSLSQRAHAPERFVIAETLEEA
jgi:hypothetical protein